MYAAYPIDLPSFVVELLLFDMFSLLSLIIYSLDMFLIIYNTYGISLSP